MLQESVDQRTAVEVEDAVMLQSKPSVVILVLQVVAPIVDVCGDTPNWFPNASEVLSIIHSKLNCGRSSAAALL